jgi:hypothetical protein
LQDGLDFAVKPQIDVRRLSAYELSSDLGDRHPSFIDIIACGSILQSSNLSIKKNLHTATSKARGNRKRSTIDVGRESVEHSA